MQTALLAGSAMLCLVAAATVHRAPSAAASAAPSAPSALGIPPLPSGAAPRDVTPPDDDPGDGCRFVDRGLGDYADARPAGRGKVFVPHARAVDADGTFPLLIHFHGGEAVRRELAPAKIDVVFVTVDAGVGSAAYARAFAEPSAIADLIAGAEAAVAAERELPSARAFPIVLSSWSAGYGAVWRALTSMKRPVNGVILLDSLYASYKQGSREVEPERLAPFVTFAKGAADAGAASQAMFLLHTAIPTPSYASTGEVATWLLKELGGEATAGEPGGAFALTRSFDRGSFHLRGHAGSDRDAHCEALRALPSALRDDVLPALAR
jgi:hypothetical protein